MTSPLESLKALVAARKNNEVWAGDWFVNGHGKVECPKGTVCLVYSSDGREHKFFYQCENKTTDFIAQAANWTASDVQSLIDRVERYEKALREIAEQKLLLEMEDGDSDADFDEAYDMCVRAARAALSEKEGE